jgi:putative DNA primase/helicase
MEKSDFAKRLADKLIEQLKAGTAPWQQPWEAGQILSPYNPTTGNRVSRD